MDQQKVCLFKRKGKLTANFTIFAFRFSFKLTIFIDTHTTQHYMVDSSAGTIDYNSNVCVSLRCVNWLLLNVSSSTRTHLYVFDCRQHHIHIISRNAHTRSVSASR